MINLQDRIKQKLKSSKFYKKKIVPISLSLTIRVTQDIGICEFRALKDTVKWRSPSREQTASSIE